MLPKPHCSLSTRCVANQPFHAFSSRFFVKTEKVLAHWHVGQVRRTVDWKGGFKREHANKETKGAGLKVRKGRMIGMLLFKMEFYIQKT